MKAKLMTTEEMEDYSAASWRLWDRINPFEPERELFKALRERHQLYKALDDLHTALHQYGKVTDEALPAYDAARAILQSLSA